MIKPVSFVARVRTRNPKLVPLSFLTRCFHDASLTYDSFHVKDHQSYRQLCCSQRVFSTKFGRTTTPRCVWLKCARTLCIYRPATKRGAYIGKLKQVKFNVKPCWGGAGAGTPSAFTLCVLSASPTAQSNTLPWVFSEDDLGDDHRPENHLLKLTGSV